MKLTEAQAEAVIRLENNQDFKMILEAMNAYRVGLIEFVLMGREETVLTYRGMARSQTEVLRALGGARDQVQRVRSRS